MLNPVEREQELHEFNATQSAWLPDRLIHRLFEEQVRLRPHAAAVACESQQLTYAELNARANQLAHFLRAQGVVADRLVGICVARGVDMMVGLLGILKAGGAYVPIDPSYPAKRVEHMFADSRPVVVLTQEDLKGALPAIAGRVIALDTDWPLIACQPSENLLTSDLQARHLAYVIYTSGSTGTPKGVMVEHHSVARFLAAANEWYRFEPRDVWTVFHSFAFDFSVLELWGAMVHGGKLVIVPHQVTRSPDDLYRLICREAVTVLSQTPSAFRQLIAAQQRSGEAHSLRTVILGGEALEASCLRAWYERNDPGRPQITNMYGPTETTVFVTYHPIEPSAALSPSAPSAIGRPIPHSRIYVLDDRDQPVPIGVTGEIHIGGAGVTRGYLNRPELTSQQFPADPFVADPKARMYRTGDLGRWRPDGTLEYLGRNDQQIKLRGFRIELGEIEAQLASHSEVNEAVVIVREDAPGEQRLVAYATLRNRAEVRIEQLRDHLRAVLPEYMIPNAFIVLESFPLTPNSKLDRRALPPPQSSAYVRREYEQPRSEMEQLLADIWQALLHVERVGRQDNFFELGGHSLLIVQMMERLRQVGLSVDMRRAFSSRTLADLAETLVSDTSELTIPPNSIPPLCAAITPQMLPLVTLEAEHIELIARAVPGGMANIKDIYPLTPLQEGMLFHHLLDGESGGDTYITPMLLAVSNRSRLDELVVALQRVIDRHDSLRTAVLWEGLPRPVQVVYRAAELPVETVALDPGRESLEQVRARLEADGQRLDLRQAPLLQVQAAASRESDEWYVLLKIHHVANDAVSLRILISEIVALLDRRAVDLPEPVPYRNHVAQTLANARLQETEAFFRSRLSDIDEPTAPFGLTDVHGDSNRILEFSDKLEALSGQRVRVQAKRLGVSSATLFHAAWALVIAHTSGRDDVVFGSVLLGRFHAGAAAQHIVGLFVNTVPLRLRLSATTADELITRTQNELVELLSHEQSSLAVAQNCSGIVGSAPLFTSVLNYRHSERDPAAEWAGATGVRFLTHRYRTNYPVGLSVDDLGDEFMLTAQTDRCVDPRQIIAYTQTALNSLVEALEQAATTPVLTLPVLPQQERRQVIELFNQTHTPYPSDKPIHALIEEQVLRTPDAVAVAHEGRSLSYAQLNARANQLARYLRDRNVGPDRLVALCVVRGVDMLVGLLGVLKAGGAYVPVDPANPVERLQHIFDDARPEVVLTHEASKSVLPQTTAKLVALDSDWKQIEKRSARNLSSGVVGLQPWHLAYVIYTSGSTGTPKGVMVKHCNVVNYATYAMRQFDVASGDGSLISTSISFDLMLTGLYPTLLCGRTVRLCPEQAGMPLLSEELPRHRNLSPLKLTPSHLALLEPDLQSGRLNGCVRVLVLGGESLPRTAVEAWRKHAPGTRIFNHYGPTETTIGCIVNEIEATPTGSVPIGRPIANTQVFILDARMQPVPIGVAGNIYIGGAGVARGYLNRPELTAERFLRNPFSADEQARIYMTGDVGRWRSDGTVEYLGRDDHQVKIRGYRIELGEIQAQLMRHPRMRQAVVVVNQTTSGEKRLVAYVTPADDGVPTVEELRAQLQTALPEYMIPSAFVVMQALPLTPNGKLDQRALPSPDFADCASRQYEAPQGEIEELLAGVWQTLLGHQRIGRHDHFFELGGHSLKAMQVSVRVQHLLSIRMPMRSLFEYPTLRQLASYVEQLRLQRQLHDLAADEDELDELLKMVRSLPDSEVRHMVHGLRQAVRS